MEPIAVVIEEHDENGIHWLVSASGPNPEFGEYVEVPSSEEAFSIKRAYDAGDRMPFHLAKTLLRAF